MENYEENNMNNDSINNNSQDEDSVNNFVKSNIDELSSFDSNKDFNSNNFDLNENNFSEESENNSIDEQNPKEIDIQPQKHKYKFFTDGYIFSFLTIFCVIISSFVFIFNYVLHPIKVVGVSMQPTINSSEYYTGDSDETHCDIVYYSKNPAYNINDIVIVLNTNDKYVPKISNNSSVSSVIKRVVGKPNYSVKFTVFREETKFKSHGIVKYYYYNIEVFDENDTNINLDQSYLAEDEEMSFNSEDLIFYSQENENYSTFYQIFSNAASDGSYTYNVPENKYFVMGDNRNNSTDSRFFGAVDYEDIAGSVKIIVPYGSNLIISIWNKLKNYA